MTKEKNQVQDEEILKNEETVNEEAAQKRKPKKILRKKLRHRNSA